MGRLQAQREADAHSATAALSTRRTGALLACLILRAPHPVPREELLGLLWPDELLVTAQNRLRVLLNALRQRLEPPPAPPDSVLIAKQGSVSLVSDAFTSDYHDFLRELRAAKDAPTEREAISHLENAVVLYQGELLPGYYEDWILTERRRLSGLRFQALREVTQRCLQIGTPERALEYALQSVACEQLDEEAHGDLIRIYAELGQPSAALRQYEQWKRLLWQQMQAQPSETLRELAARLEAKMGHGMAQNKLGLRALARSGDESNTGRYSPSENLFPQSCGNLPPRLTRFFGREAERARLRSLLSPGSANRLVSLLGPGGVGKTRLAIETAETLLPDYRGRVYFTPLADITSPAHIGLAFVRALGLPPSPGLEPLSQAATVLNQSPSLLILDNMEHLLPHAGTLIAQLLGEAPSLHCLLTSRLTAGIEGEREFALGPLPVAAKEEKEEKEKRRKGERKIKEGESQSTSHNPQSAVGNRQSAIPSSVPAVALFVDRVQAVRPEFQLTADNAEEVAQLCRELEGLPLALELAAARARVMTPGEMRQQTHGLLNWLVDVRGNKNARHRSLRATLEGSYRLLNTAEQRFFRALSVFVGGFEAQAAGHVGLGSGTSAAETLELLERLRAASILHIMETQEATTRFAMLETLREFGAERLAEAGEEVSTRQRHLAYFAHAFWSGDTPPFLWSARETGRVSGEDGNLQAALEFGLNEEASPNTQAWTLSLARRLSGYWEMQGRWNEGRAYLQRAAQLPYSEENFSGHISVLRGAGMLSCLLGEYETASAFTAEALRKSEGADYLPGIAGCRNIQGNIAFQQDDYLGAQKRFEQARAIYQELQDAPQIARCLLNLGNTTFFQGEDNQAQARFQDALHAYRQAGDRLGVASALLRLGNVRRQQGSYSNASEYLLESLTCFQDMGHRQGAAGSLGALGMLARFQNHSDQAQQYYTDALAIFQSIGSQRGVAVCILNLGEVAQAQGDTALAASHFQQAMLLCRKIGDRRDLAACLYSQGQLELGQGRSDKARLHFEEALHIERDIHSRGGIANCLAGLGMVMLAQDNLQEAQTQLGKALQTYHNMGALPGVVLALQACAQLALQQGELVRAARLMGAASVLQTQIGSFPSDSASRGKAVLSALRATMDAALFAASWQQGERLSTAEVVTLALQSEAQKP